MELARLFFWLRHWLGVFCWHSWFCCHGISKVGFVAVALVRLVSLLQHWQGRFCCHGVIFCCGIGEVGFCCRGDSFAVAWLFVAGVLARLFLVAGVSAW